MGRNRVEDQSPDLFSTEGMSDPSTNEATDVKKTRPRRRPTAAIPRTRGQVNAVRAAFKAGVTPGITMRQLALSFVMTVAIVNATCCIPVYAQNRATAALPPEFHGLWVESSSRECPKLTRDEDAYGMGEGALLLGANKVYSHESLCKITGRVIGACCDGDDERTIAANISCSGSKGRVVLYLRHSDGEVMLVESYENSASGPVVKIYRKKCM